MDTKINLEYLVVTYLSLASVSIQLIIKVSVQREQAPAGCN